MSHLAGGTIMVGSAARLAMVTNGFRDQHQPEQSEQTRQPGFGEREDALITVVLWHGAATQAHHRPWGKDQWGTCVTA